MNKQKLAAWFVGFLLVATLVSYGVLKYVKEGMDQRSYKGLDETMSTLDKLEDMQENGAYDFKYKVIDPFADKLEDEKALKDFKALKGHVVLLNFWASWCEPCIQEFPDLVALAEAVPEIKILAVSRDFELEEAKSFIKAFPEAKDNIIFSWDDSGKITGEYGTEVLPESYVIGKDFKVIKKVSGIENWDHKNIIEYFKLLVKN